MIGIHKQVVEDAIKEFTTELKSYDSQALSRLEKIQTDLKNKLSKKENEWLNRLIIFYKKHGLMAIDLIQLEKLKDDLKKLPEPATHLNQKKTITLKNKIKGALDYKGIRRDFLPKYFQKIGVKACVYCNSQLTVTIEKIEKDYKAKFQVDHYYPQGTYPYLSISLYNLYPTCASCNHSKLDDIIDFQLYQDPIAISPYSFSIDRMALGKYMTSKDYQDLKILFHDPMGQSDTSFEKKFHVSSIYQTQKDLAEEIILKSHIYNDAYKETLQKSFQSLISDKKVIDRMLWGNYVEPHEIHKRPMAKFVQDITKDIKAYLLRDDKIKTD